MFKRLAKKPKSIPRLVVVEPSHFKLLFFRCLGFNTVAVLLPIPYLLKEYKSRDRKLAIRSLPTVPHPRRSFIFERNGKFSLINFSSEIRQAAENEGKNPHLFLYENTVEPSARTVAVNRYLLS